MAFRLEGTPIPGMLAIITGRRGGSPVLTPEAPPAAPAPAEQEVPTLKLPPEEPENVGRKRFLAFLGGAGLGVAVELTPLHLLLNPLVEKALQALRLMETPVPSYFDNKNEKGVIGINNIITADLETIREAADTALLTPIGGIGSSVNPIAYSKDLLGKNPSNPIFPPEIREQAIEQKVRNIVIFERIPKDTILVAPHDGEALFSRRPRVAPEGTAEAVSISYEDSSGKVYNISLFGNPGDLFAPLIETQSYTGESNVDREKLRVPVKRGQPILKTLQDGDIELSAMARPSKNSPGSTIYPVDVNLLTLLDPTTGEEKLLVVR